MRKTKSWRYRFQQVVFGSHSLSFEDKLLLSATLVMSVICFFSVFSNLLLGLDYPIVLTAFVGFVVSLALYLFFRFKARPKIMYFVTALLMLLYFDFGWLFNYGSNGPVFLFFIVLYAFIVLLFYRKYYWYFTVLLLINVSGLFLLEYYRPDLPGAYPNFQSKLLDNYLGFLFSILIVMLFLDTIKNNYLKEYERAKKSDQLKSAFLANMSHEIRTPLNAIVGFSSLIVDQTIEERDKQEFLNHILHNSDNLLNLIGDIVDVSKIESNQLELNLRQVDVLPAINEIIGDFQTEYRSSDKIAVINKINVADLILNVDELKLMHVFRHLLTNAVKFTEKGTVEIGCSQESGFWIFWIKDSGVGIKPEHRDEIFNRFIKLENSNQHLYRGTGIGLYLCKELITRMGGEIWVESEYGRGSTFYFSLPM